MTTPAISTTQSAQDIILGGLKRINAYAPGQPLDATTAADALQLLNDMMDSWSNDNLLCFASVENILYFTGGQSTYTVGNPTAANPLTGTFAVGSPTITGVTGLASSGMVAGIGGVAAAGVSQVASTLIDTQNAFPAGTFVLAFNPAAQTVTMSAPATRAITENFYYTLPGNFGIPRPNNPTGAFTRINTGNTGLDYYCDIKSNEEWIQIGYKGVPGPWPTALYCDQSYPYANYYFYPVPNQAGELHLWTDVLLQGFPLLTTKFNLPPGYARLLKLGIALELWPEYKKAELAPDWLEKQFTEAKALIEAKNQKKQGIASYDRNLPRSRSNDAGWIYDGGFNR